MNEQLTVTAKQIGDALIDMSDSLDANMEKWSDVSGRPNDLGQTECVGFITKEADAAGLNLVVDIQAPANTGEAILRVWGIESKLDDNQDERFNNIQLDFDMDYAAARVITQKGEAVTRDDIRAALQRPDTRLSHLTVSNQSGFDEASQRPVGERYDLDSGAPDQDDVSEDTISAALRTVLATLKDSAAA